MPNKINRDAASANVAVDRDDLPYAIWDVCDSVFGAHATAYRKSESVYRIYLRTAFAAALGRVDLLVPDGLLGPLRVADLLPTVTSINQWFDALDIDLVAVHYKSLHPTSDPARETHRVFGGSLGEAVANARLIEDRDLEDHAFDKAKKNGSLLFHFGVDSGIGATGSKGEVSLTVDESRWLTGTMAGWSRNTKLNDAIDLRLNTLPMSLSPKLRQFMSEQVDHPTPGTEGMASETAAQDIASLRFAIQSCVVTLGLLARDTDTPRYNLPRSVLLVPVFVGEKRIGGVSFFSKDLSKLRSSKRRLTVFGRTMLTFVRLKESYESEETRVAERLNPLTHVFNHTITKAYLTPGLNWASEFRRAARALVNPGTEQNQGRRSTRLRLIADTFEIYARRLTGAIPGVQSVLSGGVVERPRFLRPAEVRFDPKRDAADLERHVKAIFAIDLAADVYDADGLDHFREVLAQPDGLNRVTTLTINLPGPDRKVWGEKQLWLLHLTNLIQNSIESLPLGKDLRPWGQDPRSARPVRAIEVTHSDGTDPMTGATLLLIDVCDNGSAFDEGIRVRLEARVDEFSRRDRPQPARLAAAVASGTSTKSGGAFGSALLSLADYLSRFCLVRWQRAQAIDNDRSPEALRDGEVLLRGRLTVLPDTREGGAWKRVRMCIPYAALDTDRIGVFFELFES